MAKVVKCALCGKEVTKGIFSSESENLDFNSLSYNLTCCNECYSANKAVVKRIRNRFVTKCENIRRARKAKLTQAEIAELYKLYLKEEKEHKEKIGNQVLDIALNSFLLNKNGYFSVREFGKGFMDKDITATDMIKSAEKSQNDTECYAFNKDDITKIEYAKVGTGDFNGLFQKVYSFAIRLNDETTMTYKPCITRAVSYGGGFGFGYQKSAEKKLVRILNDFRMQIGSDLPIVKVKKI